MAVTPVTAELLVIDTISTDFVNGGGGTLNNIIGNTTDGWEISPPSGEILGEKLFLRLVADGGGTVNITLKAGDRYPAQRADLGDTVLSLNASDEVFVAIETSRYLQDDGKIIIVPADSGSILTALIMPRSG